ncbi:glutamic acid-rich protein-like [Clytia hemisphaerica]|uniref:glutamic acid-rich protein-like n=1 Tax=Clytia hemisphaerica TaxID=252671 RepID=UPI0034D3E13A
MKFKILVLTLVFALAAAEQDDFRDDIRELGKLDQNTLYKVLKHENLRDHVELDEEDHEFLSKLSKDELQDMIQQFSEGAENDDLKDQEMSQDENEDSKMLDENDENLRSLEEQEDDKIQSDEQKDEEDTELAKNDKVDEEIDDFDFDHDEAEVERDPLLFGRRRRRRRRRRRSGRRRWWRRVGGWFRRAFKSIAKFLKKHGEIIKKGVKALRRGIHHCCNVTKKCSGKWFCKFGKAKKR